MITADDSFFFAVHKQDGLQSVREGAVCAET